VLLLSFVSIMQRHRGIHEGVQTEGFYVVTTDHERLMDSYSLPAGGGKHAHQLVTPVAVGDTSATGGGCSCFECDYCLGINVTCCAARRCCFTILCFTDFCLSIHSYPLAPSRSPKTPVYSGVWLGQLLGNTVLQPLEQMRSSISYSYRVQVVATPESCRPDRLNMKMPQQLNY
jgi:hypothetical protein